jgi:hypothetical protein
MVSVGSPQIVDSSFVEDSLGLLVVDSEDLVEMKKQGVFPIIQF